MSTLPRGPGDRGVTRRTLLIAIGAGALALPFASRAQQPSRMPRIGLLWIEGESSPQYIAALRDGLRALGYVEGRNIQIDDRFLVKDYTQIAGSAARLAEQKVDIIICYGATTLREASKATTTIPIVMVSGGDPVKLGVAASLARPGGNVTGMTVMSQELSGKRLGLLKETVPGLRRLAVVLYPDSAAEVESLRGYEAAARALNVEVRPVEIRTPAEIAPAIAAIARMDAQAIAVVGSTLMSSNMNQLLAAVEMVRLPAMYSNSAFPPAGGLMSYATSFHDGFRKAATYVDKILKGAKPGDIPIEQPTKFELAVNLKTAKALGIKIPSSILVRADRVIE